MKITNYKCVDEKGITLFSDAFGNNVAVNCPDCNHSILFIARLNQKGSSENHATQCNGCRASFFIEVSEDSESIVVRGKH